MFVFDLAAIAALTVVLSFPLVIRPQLSRDILVMYWAGGEGEGVMDGHAGLDVVEMDLSLWAQR